MVPPIVKRFLISFEQNKWFGLLSILIGTGIGFIFAIQPPKQPPPPTYKAIGQLSFRVPPPAFTTAGNQLQQQGRSVSKDMLLSSRVLQGVQKKLQLDNEELIAIRDKNLAINFPGEGAKPSKEAQPQLIVLEYTDKDSPTRATLILETFMSEMVDYSRWLNTYQLRSRIDALSQRLAQVQKGLTKAEGKFYRYISKEGSDLLAIQDGSLFSGITSSQQQRRTLKLALEEVDGQIKSLMSQLGLNPQQAYISIALSADPILANLRARILDNELQLQRLQADLRPEHPTVVKLLKEQKVNETLLQQRATELLGANKLTSLPQQIRQESNLDPRRQQLAARLLALQTQHEGLLKQLASVVKTERELRQEYEKSPDKQLQQARLVQEVEFQRSVYQNILTTLVDAQAAEAETVGSLTVAIPATPQPTQAPGLAKNNRGLMILAGMGIGAVAGFGVILLLALVDDRLHTPQELRDALSDREVPLLGQLPLIAMVSEDSNPVLLDVDSIYLPFYERFRSNIRRLGPDASRVILITSITNEEGKSLTAYNLAITSASAGKRTLLIEADLRAPSQADLLAITPHPEANLEPLRYYAARSDAISLVPAIANLYILPSPGPQRQAAAVIESSELQQLIKDSRGRFDLVIIDTSSLARCNDALLLEPLTDGIILVTRPGITRSSLLSEAIDQCTEAEIPLLGAVINGVEGLATATSTSEFSSFTSDTSESNTETYEEAKVQV